MRKAHKNTPWANTGRQQRTQMFVKAREELCGLLSLTLFKSDSTGKLGFHEFKHLWDNVKKWQASTACLFHLSYTRVSVQHSSIPVVGVNYYYYYYCSGSVQDL